MRAFGFGPKLKTPSTRTARQMLQAAGINADAPGMQVAIDGVPSSPDAPVTPGSSVSLWPQANNG